MSSVVAPLQANGLSRRLGRGCAWKKNPTPRQSLWAFPLLWNLGFLLGLFPSSASDWGGLSGRASYFDFTYVGILGARPRVGSSMCNFRCAISQPLDAR
eukprot:8259868-Pyramimonas_sp.AAC.1